MASIATLVKTGCPLEHTLANADVSFVFTKNLQTLPRVAEGMNTWCFVPDPKLPPVCAHYTWISRVTAHYHWLAEIDINRGELHSDAIRGIVDSLIVLSLRRLSLSFCEEAGNPQSLMHAN